MFETLSALPLSFWVVIIIMAAAAGWARRRLQDGTGLPMLAVLGTVTAWYIGDVFYNDYTGNHAQLFDHDVLQNAWWEVAWFVVVLVVATPFFHRWLNARYTRETSGAMRLFAHGVGNPAFQTQLDRVFAGCMVIWITLAIIATILLRDQAIYYFLPLLGYRANPWAHGRVGVGLDFFSVPAVYLQLLVTSIFGVVLALSTRRKTRSLALFFCLYSYPFFFFDQVRNTMLTILVPGILCYVFLRLRCGMLLKLAALGVFFLLISAWFGFVIKNRTEMSIITALNEKGFNLRNSASVHHQGLNMYEELCWINTFIKGGIYSPNWGQRYFAEIVNPVPRVLWKDKPFIGLDYAKLRGQDNGGEGGQGGVNATISTGMIGQGVVNFGRVIGPAFAALLMSMWVALLARLDLEIERFGRLPLYGMGLILTFNMGRDISLIILYQFFFGIALVAWVDHHRLLKPSQTGQQPQPSTATTPGIVERTAPPPRVGLLALKRSRIRPIVSRPIALVRRRP